MNETERYSGGKLKMGENEKSETKTVTICECSLMNTGQPMAERIA